MAQPRAFGSFNGRQRYGFLDEPWIIARPSPIVHDRDFPLRPRVQRRRSFRCSASLLQNEVASDLSSAEEVQGAGRQRGTGRVAGEVLGMSQMQTLQ